MKTAPPTKQINSIFKCNIMATNRKRNNVYGRIGFSAYLRHQKFETLRDIGDALKKNHATIIHYIKEHDQLMKYDKNYLEMFNKMTRIHPSKKWLCNECVYELKS